jgi:hypothetical protein
MKKLLISAAIFAAILFAETGIASAACTPYTSTFPASLDTFTANDCIPSAWANELEAVIGATNSLVSSTLQYIANHSINTWYSNDVNPASSTVAIAASNTTYLYGYKISEPLQCSAFTWIVGAADSSTDAYDLGLYTPSGTTMSLIADVGATSTYFTTTGIKTASTTQGLVTFYPANAYYFGVTGNSTTLQLDASLPRWSFLINATGSLSVGGQLPTTSTIPTSTWNYGSSPSLVCHQ